MFDPSAPILIVDDMGSMRKIVIKTCKELGFTQFTEAPDGATGWETLCAAAPPIALVISAWHMPACSGLDLLKRVRSDSRFKSLPFILITAESEKTEIIEAAKLGMSGCIVKPFTSEALKNQLAEAYKRIYG